VRALISGSSDPEFSVQHSQPATFTGWTQTLDAGVREKFPSAARSHAVRAACATAPRRIVPSLLYTAPPSAARSTGTGWSCCSAAFFCPGPGASLGHVGRARLPGCYYRATAPERWSDTFYCSTGRSRDRGWRNPCCRCCDFATRLCKVVPGRRVRIRPPVSCGLHAAPARLRFCLWGWVVLKKDFCHGGRGRTRQPCRVRLPLTAVAPLLRRRDEQKLSTGVLLF